MMPDFVIGNDGFGKNLANALGCQYKQVVHEFYSDNESCPRIMADYNEIAGKDVAVVLRTSQKPTRESVACFLFCCEDIISPLARTP